MIKYSYLLIFICISFVNGQNLNGIDLFIKESINQQLTPNVNLVIGNNTANLYLKSFGYYTYSNYSKSVDNNSIYDLASLTKVFATTLCIMKLYDDNKLNLDDKVIEYIPDFGENGKDDITIKNLLLHNSGLPAYYSPKNNQSPTEIINSIFKLNKAYKTGEKYLYSCLNFVTLMKVVEAITGKQMYQYYKEIIIDPLNLTDTFFIPPDSIKYKIIPTTPNLQGKVHDPLAFGLNGLSGNAGLFSTTKDLAKICRMLLNKGEFEGKNIFSESTVLLFITQYDSSSSRALGWDTNGFLTSSAGTYFSKQTFGHTGYTGTSVWIDPVNNIFVVLLTNRVYPDDKVSLTEMRITLHNYIFMNLSGIPPQPIIESLILKDSSVVVTYNNQSTYVPVDSTYLIYSINNISNIPLLLPNNKSEFSIPLVATKQTKIDCKLYNVRKSNVSLFSDEFSLLNKQSKVLIIDANIIESSVENKYNTYTKNYINNLPSNYGYECVNINYSKNMKNFDDYKTLIIYSSESSALSPFTDSIYIEKLINYVNNGGNILITGSEFGWYLGRAEAGNYLNNIYKKLFNAQYISDNASTNNLIINDKKLLSSEKISFGTEKAIYKTRTPDVFKPINNSVPLFLYNEKETAGNIITLGKGKIIYLAFPFESIESNDIKKDLMYYIMEKIFVKNMD
ncbi:MAG TPA: serine hydrolase [Melioribacteraceae bacterium]|nr:serine hydrolase [Melioribacteraceae bacterium]